MIGRRCSARHRQASPSGPAPHTSAQIFSPAENRSTPLRSAAAAAAPLKSAASPISNHSQRALSRHHVRVGEGMEISASLLMRKGQRTEIGFVPDRADDLDRRPPFAQLFDLGLRDVGRHEDGRWHPGQLCRPRDGKAVIAARGSGDPARHVLRRRRQQLVGGATRLEGTRHLQAFELQPKLRLGNRRAQRIRLDQRRAAHMRRDPLARLVDIVQRDHRQSSSGEATTRQQLPGRTRPGWRLP